MWKLLRCIEGCHSRRQAPVGAFVFDFADLDRRLVIELDGDIHDLPAVRQRDQVNTESGER